MSAVAQLQSEASFPLTISPLQPTIGAEIAGVDLREPLTPALRDEIKAAILKYKVVFFRDQHITREQQAAFARQFGPLYTHPTTKQTDTGVDASIHRIAAVDFQLYEKEAAVRAKDEIQEFYHTDTSWRLVPTWGAVLRAVTLPDVGGDTIWVDAGLAYRNLPDDIRERLEGLHVTHDFRNALLCAGHDYPIVAHKIVRTHRETGEKILWVNFSQHPTIIGLDRAESRALLEEVAAVYRRPEHQVRFSWRPGSIAFWDNRASVHYAVRNYGDFPRLLERILIQDEKLYADL
ncbi:TauD/TfdA dioxygenase family protein [Beijerinckia indica]|uniref:Taurine dioxygenase n=1 Tax=Beijerinckia indica subsp. indica (strain ATCC 9039 / DSM 1715 / NCIMB 8712) TaxID=395963 RepID=B2IBM1_BEII9|nr:TauD/TfdA family dioxygenase [Beijerinckia indica]ACB96647.1 Taurine dioxygenase [Beijerinckia indica subsp. indica ATCC 9039]